ncbi:MAG: hypothetical protein H7Y59_07195 [Anaerolineales bacterium]|nr:hypothetical protein [Anaerolineales bacterium]
MKTQLEPRAVGEQEWTATILGIAILFGVFVRILPAILAGFPINDGGMFAVMISDLKGNGFILPEYTTYNHFNIPYAYPPLGFYIGAFLELTGISFVNILMWIPALLTSLTLPLFYFFVKEVTDDRPCAALATAFFAFAPGNYVWLLMGGGLTRALGIIFFLASLIFVHCTFVTPNWRTTAFAIILCSLVVLSHPQAALLTVISCVVFWIFFGRSQIGTIHAFVIALGTLLLTAPWWGTVVYKHGINIFLSAGQSGDLSASLSALWENLFSIQTIIPFATIFRLFGVFFVVYNRKYWLLIWGFLPYFVDQRSASIVTSFLYPILAAYGFLNILPALLGWVRTRKWVFEKNNILMANHTLSMSLLLILFYLIIECFVHAYVIRNVTLSYDARGMMVWIKENAAEDSEFLIVTGRVDVMTDGVQEWFPALADRHSVTTLQGLEWILEQGFYSRWDELSVLQTCKDINCIESMGGAMNFEFTHIIFDRYVVAPDLSNSFIENGYKLVFENGQYVVLEK